MYSGEIKEDVFPPESKGREEKRFYYEHDVVESLLDHSVRKPFKDEK